MIPKDPEAVAVARELEKQEPRLCVEHFAWRATSASKSRILPLGCPAAAAAAAAAAACGYAPDGPLFPNTALALRCQELHLDPAEPFAQHFRLHAESEI